MLLKLYNLDHALIGGLKRSKDVKVESVLSSGDKTLSFLWHQKNALKIPQEYYIRTDTDEYVVKENSKTSNGYRSITANLNLEDIEGRPWMDYTVESVNAKAAADYALTDTGWTCVSTVPENRIRNISMKKTSALQVIEKILEAFTCEVRYDTLKKVVYLSEKIGSDKGVYFIKGLNLKELTDTGDTYDYVTRIIPIGADDLRISDVNGGKEYLENFQYSKKVKTLIWEDSNYTDAQALKDDAKYKLNEISKPRKSLSAKVVDLAKLKPKYSILSYTIGDTVTLVSNEDGIREKQRITKMTEYPDHPEKNTCEISNTVLSFEELQKKLFAAAECIDNVTTDNGTINGSKVDSIDVTQIIGLDRYISEDMDDLKVNYLYVRTEFGTPHAVLGEAVITTGNVTNLNVTEKETSALSYITELHSETTYGTYAKFKTIEADNLSALEERVDHLQADYADIDFANVDVAKIRQGFLKNLMVEQGIIADRVVGTEVVATDTLTGVNLVADDITAGTLSVDRLIFRGSKKSIIYELNNISGALQAVSSETLNGEIITPRSIAADRIAAKSITANEINVTDLRSTGFIGANKLTAVNIEVDDLRALGATIGGFTIGTKAIYNGTDSATSVKAGIYIGTDAIRAYTSADAYTKIENGKLTCCGAVIKNGSLNIDTKSEERSWIEINGETQKTHIGAGSTYIGDDEYRVLIRPSQLSLRDATGVREGIEIKPDKISLIDKQGADVMRIAREEPSKLLDLEAYRIAVGTTVDKTYALAASSFICNSWIRTKGSTGWYNQDYGGGWYMTDSTYIRSYGGKSVLISGNTYFGSASYYVNNSGGAKLKSVTSEGDVTASGKLLANSQIGYTTAYSASQIQIYCQWRDKNNHNIITREADGLTLYLGWGGSSSYKTKAVIRGQTVQYTNSSGTSTLSDERLKNSFKNLNEYDDVFMNMEPVAYRYNNGSSGRFHFGFKAQNIRDALLKAGFTTQDFGGIVQMEDDPTSEDYCGVPDPLGLIYTEFTAWNTHMIQKTALRVNRHDEEILELRQRVNDLERRLETAEQKAVA